HATTANDPGHEKVLAVMFCDMRGFTAMADQRLPFDVVFLLNRYFGVIGRAVESSGGRLDKFVGDGLMAIFGVQGQDDAPVRAVNAALQTLATVDRLKPFFASMYGIDFDIRVGLHLGEAVIGS
ncbi:adenylate/guanylate cyclase domain-containing protein, partial [bacterium M00.F.Ca.ET.141.01.1.1]